MSFLVKTAIIMVNVEGTFLFFFIFNCRGAYTLVLFHVLIVLDLDF